MNGIVQGRILHLDKSGDDAGWDEYDE
jgi:hypothetical protein